MAPRKRNAMEQVKTTPARVTRSFARKLRGNSKISSVPLFELPERRRSKVMKKKEALQPNEKSSFDAEKESDGMKVEEADEQKIDSDQKLKKTVVVEYCYQCNSFKTRANKVKGGLENALPEITVLLNPIKPRKGCFEVREEGGKKFISLLDMKRPYDPMKKLNMENVITDIIHQINNGPTWQ